MIVKDEDDMVEVYHPFYPETRNYVFYDSYVGAKPGDKIAMNVFSEYMGNEHGMCQVVAVTRSELMNVRAPITYEGFLKPCLKSTLE